MHSEGCTSGLETDGGRDEVKVDVEIVESHHYGRGPS